MLIGTDGYMPPMGAVGEIVEAFDGEDYGVDFPKHPCPVGPEPYWYVPPHMLMPIEGGKLLTDDCEHRVTLTFLAEDFTRCAECGAVMVGGSLREKG